MAAALIESGAISDALAAIETALTLNWPALDARLDHLSTGDLAGSYGFRLPLAPRGEGSRQHLFDAPLCGAALGGPLLIWGKLGRDNLFAGLVRAARAGQPVILV